MRDKFIVCFNSLNFIYCILFIFANELVRKQEITGLANGRSILWVPL